MVGLPAPGRHLALYALMIGCLWVDGDIGSTLAAPLPAGAPLSSPDLESLSRDRRWLELLAAADQAMQSDPGAADPMIYRVRALRMLGHIDAAQRLAKATIDRFPQNAAVLVEHGWLASLRGDWPTALAAACQAANLRPELAEAALLEGIGAREQRDWKTAEAAFARADRLRPNDPLILLNRGRVAVELGAWDTAIAYLDRSIGLDPRSAAAFFQRGRAQAARGRLPEASRDLTRALELRPEAAPAYAARSAVLGRAGAWAAAAADADTALALGVTDLSLYLTACRAAEARADWDSLERHARAMIKAFPDDAQGYRFLFHALTNLDRPEEALQACNLAVQRAPAESLLRLERATLLITLQRYPDAVADCSEALRQEQLPLAYALRGLAWLRQHDLDRAEENAINALTLAPDTATALLIRAEVHLVRGSQQEAVKLARRAVTLAPQLTWAQMTLGKALLATGQTHAALTAAEQVLALAPDSAEGYALRARCHTALGNSQAARADLTALLHIDPALGQQLQTELAL